MQEDLGLTFKNPRELNKIIDEELPGKPQFRCHTIYMPSGQGFDVHYRPIMDCLKSLFNDPNFAQHLIYAPERHYADQDTTIRVYHDLHTGKWWWNVQVSLFFLTI